MEQIREQAIRFLARREHSRIQLQAKLIAKGWNKDQILPILEDLIAVKLLDDNRYASSYIRYRAEAGYGPRKIKAELVKNGIKEISTELIDETSNEWQDRLKKLWQKKFKNKFPQNDKTKAQQIRFLLYRGFTSEQVNNFLKKDCRFME